MHGLAEQAAVTCIHYSTWRQDCQERWQFRLAVSVCGHRRAASRHRGQGSHLCNGPVHYTIGSRSVKNRILCSRRKGCARDWPL